MRACWEGLEAQCAGREEAMVLCRVLPGGHSRPGLCLASSPTGVGPGADCPPGQDAPGLLRLQNGVFRLLPARAFAGQGMGKDQVLSLTRSMLALDLTPALDAVCQPTLVLCGEKDRVNQSAAREIARRLPHGRYEQAAGAGHAVNQGQARGRWCGPLQTVAMMKPPV